MSELDAFEAKVRQNIKLLSSPDPKRRRQAAVWLGEAGDPSAITRLRQVYEEDHDPKVRAAAAYSLGMFRALEEGLAGPNQEKIVTQLRDIALKGKMGRRTRIPIPFLRQVVFGLFISALILLAFNFIIWPQIKDQISSPTGGRSAAANEDDLSADASAYLNNLRSDVDTLRGQYLRVLGGGTVDCSTPFNEPAALEAHGTSAEIIAELNEIRAAFDEARGLYHSACREDDPATLSAADMSAPLATLLDALGRLNALGAFDPAAEISEPTAEAPVEATPEPDISEPTEAAADPVVTELLMLIETVRASRGPVLRLNSYWEDIRERGQSDGCVAAQPAIPDDYTLSGDATPTREGESLSLAVELVNTGLALTRQSWMQFNAACISADPQAAVEAGLQSANSALISFDLAQSALNVN